MRLSSPRSVSPRRCLPVPTPDPVSIERRRMSGIGFGHRSNSSVLNRTSQTGVQRSTVSGLLATQESIPKKRNCGLKKATNCFARPRRVAKSGTNPCSLTPLGRRNSSEIVTLGANSDKSLFPVHDNRPKRQAAQKDKFAQPACRTDLRPSPTLGGFARLNRFYPLPRVTWHREKLPEPQAPESIY
jgi:hypothetical protein